MIRIVDWSKAIAAGVAGAVAMELASSALRLAGVPAVDLIAELGSVAGPRGNLAGIVPGLVAHAGVGIAWALFYAYFFWGRFRWPPPLQGMVFSILPATLAVLFVYPQLQLMQLQSDVVQLGWGDFFSQLSHDELISILLAHAVFGLTVGALYTRPVGYRTGRCPRPPAPPVKIRRTDHRKLGSPSAFIFATGIECSYPTIEHCRWRRDQMDGTGHYRLWQEDFELCRQLGITHLRYGPPLHLAFTGPGSYDWSWLPQLVVHKIVGWTPFHQPRCCAGSCCFAK